MNPFDRKWYCFNDEFVKEIDIYDKNYHTTGGESPYILFYCKKKFLF